MKKAVRACLLAACVLAISWGAAGCRMKRVVLVAGETMGTTYQVKVVASVFRPVGTLERRIGDRLLEINRSMSTYLPDSEISRFNALESGQEMTVSEDFFSVLRVAEKIHRLTAGAWDGTVMPLVDLWGFGPAGFVGVVPPSDEISRCVADVGLDGIRLKAGRVLEKVRGRQVRLDLASIAKGYGVDALAELLAGLGYEDFLVEIGGEVAAAGRRLDGKPWRVGINRPSKDAGFGEVYRVLALQDQALATSGDYRNFFEIDGRTYSHVIDPRTGYPVANGVVSVSVVADTCVFADGLATAMMVMGPGQAVALADALPRVSCLVVVRAPDGRFTDYRSQGFTE